MSAVAALMMAAGLFAGSSIASPITQRQYVSTPFNLTATASQGGETYPLYACHTGAGLAVLCSDSTNGPAYEFDFNATAPTNTATGPTSAGALVWYAQPANGGVSNQPMSFTQYDGNVAYASFGYETTYTSVGFFEDNTFYVVQGDESSGANIYLCPYTTDGGSINYQALAFVYGGAAPSVDGCVPASVRRIFSGASVSR